MICEGRIEMRGPSRGVTRSRAHDRCVFSLATLPSLPPRGHLLLLSLLPSATPPTLHPSPLQVPDVSIVIDLGFEKLPFFDAATNTDSLLLRRASRASAMQRAGRAGRCRPGRLPAPLPPVVPRQSGDHAVVRAGRNGADRLLNLLLKARLMDPTAPAASVLS